MSVTLAFRFKLTFISPSCEVLNRVFCGQTKLIVSSVISVFVTCSWRKFRRPKNIIRKTGTSRNSGEYCCKRRIGYNSISVMWPFRPQWKDYYCKLCICQVVREGIVGEMVLKYDVTGAWSIFFCGITKTCRCCHPIVDSVCTGTKGHGLIRRTTVGWN